MRRKRNLLLVFLIIPFSYFLIFNNAFDAADESWPYSMLHFVDYKFQILFVLFLLFVFVVLIFDRESFDFLDRKIMTLGIIGIGIILFLKTAQLFFDLHYLSMGSSSSSRYAPITESTWLVIISLVVSNVSMTLLVLRDKSNR